jgi:hypothetical protein
MTLAFVDANVLVTALPRSILYLASALETTDYQLVYSPYVEAREVLIGLGDGHQTVGPHKHEHSLSDGVQPSTAARLRNPRHRNQRRLKRSHIRHARLTRPRPHGELGGICSSIPPRARFHSSTPVETRKPPTPQRRSRHRSSVHKQLPARPAGRLSPPPGRSTASIAIPSINGRRR